MTQPAGWYDDPRDSESLRYWDGVQWTSHSTPKRMPGLDRQESAQSHTDATAGYGAPAGQAPPAPWGPAQSGYQPGVGAPMTPDGVPIAGWWRRAAARVLDVILINLVVSGVAIFLMPADLPEQMMGWVEGIMEDPGASANAALPADVDTFLAQLTVITAVVVVLYEILMVSYFGGTVGKLALGLRVRLREQPGNPTMSVAATRAAVVQINSLLGWVPGIGFLTFPFTVINYLWPLWDVNNQAIHDKAAKTNVVRHIRD